MSAAGPLKILHVVYLLEPGGMENGLVNVARRLSPAEWDVHVCCLERSGAFATRLPKPAQVYPLERPPGPSLRTVVRLARLIRWLRPEVVHTHNLGPLFYGGLATALGRWVPLLHGEHGQLTEMELSPRRLRQRRWFYRACRKVHTVSRGLRDHLVQLGLPEEKIEVLVNGVDAGHFSPGSRKEARAQLGLPADALVLGVVGRFIPSKRHAALIEAFTAARRQFLQAHLLVVGAGGTESEAVAAQVRASAAAERIHLAGFQADPRPFYRAMDVLVAPSIHEGLSNVVLEAMACGVPVLAHTACGNAEVIAAGEDGLLADLGTRELLVNELQKLLASPDRLPALGEQARKKAETQFSLDAMVRGYERIYREVARPRG
jgi:glycosyltransferase involved in cell wall biosynthesis